ncbi:metallophosphoesterase [Pontibacter sp. KCTC 32443]|uniref:metallophosphoesterase family protein n=1 Tax=Pontibacter TaxID=323449 RepID=UPI00164D1898|nr:MULTISPECIES: metallophosphoesterase [Pontibacter]MBC5773270.1 metallophosphoesterase [Pontibacter sp. KCTC 32443]
MLVYFLIIVPSLFIIFLLFSYWQEWKYRRKPYYKLADVGWRQTLLPPEAEKAYSLAILGDVGAVATDGTDPVLAIFREWQEMNKTAGMAVFLGDNIYPVGLPPEGHRHRAMAEARLQTILQQLQDYKTRCAFLSGNHDWNKGRADGYQYMLRQEKYITEALQSQESYLPPHGCPGPVTMQLAEGLLLLVINTQWWVQRGEKPLGAKYNCPYNDIEEFYIDLNNLLRRNRHQRIVIAAHHPLYSNALHGGKFTIKQHLFPLTAANKRFLIPLPILGSLYPFYRKFFGAYEDMSHKRYKQMRKRLLQIFHRYQNIIYVAGHDHNLQHFEKRGNHYLVSGSGSKTSFVKKGGSATFTLEQPGFAILNYYQNGEVWLEMHVVSSDKTDTASEVVFRKKLESIVVPQQALV